MTSPSGLWAEGDSLSPTNLNRRNPVGTFPAKIYHVAWASGTGTTQINNAITNALAGGYNAVFIDASRLPYDASAVTFNANIHMLREGQENIEQYDVKAYGAQGSGLIDEYAACQAAANAASVNASVSGALHDVFFPHGTYAITQAISCDHVRVIGQEAFVGGTAGTAVHGANSFSGPLFVSQSRTASISGIVSPLVGTGHGLRITDVSHWFNLRDSAIGDLNGLAAFTFECFFKNNLGAGNLSLLLTSRGKLLAQDTRTDALLWYVGADGKLVCSVNLSGGTVSLSAGGTNVYDSAAYHHLALSYDGTTVRMFVDGALANSGAGSGTLVQGFDEGVCLGKDFDLTDITTASGSVLNGTIQDLRGSNIARYTTAFTAPTTNLSNDANTLFLFPFDLQVGLITRAKTKDGDCWLVMRDAATPGNGGGAFEMHKMALGGAGGALGNTGIHLVGNTYNWQLKNVNLGQLRIGLIGTGGNVYFWHISDVYQNALGVGRYGFWLNGTGGIGQVDTLWTQAASYHFVTYSPLVSFTNWFAQGGAITVINGAFINTGTDTPPPSLRGCAFNAEAGVSALFRTPLAFGGSFAAPGITAESCTFETGNNAPYVICDNNVTGKFANCTFAQFTNPTSIMQARGTFTRPVIFDSCHQTGTWIPWSDTTGTAAVGLLGTLYSSSTGSTLNFNASVADEWDLTLTSDVTKSSWTKISYGQPVSGAIKMDSTGSRLFVWPTNSKGTATLSYGSSAVNTFTGFYDGVNVILTSVRTGL